MLVKQYHKVSKHVEQLSKRDLLQKNFTLGQLLDTHFPIPVCDTGTSGQRRSDSNIELVRFLNSHKGDGVRAVFAGIQLLYKNKTPRDRPSKIAHR